MVHCGTLCRAIPNGNRRADTIRPYELKNFEPSAKYAPGVMRYVCVGVVLRAANQNPMIAGGDHTIIQRLSAAQLFPRWGNNVGAMRRQCGVEHLQMEFGGIMYQTWCICNIGTMVWPIRFCSEICHVGGRIISAPTFGACNVGGRVPPNYRCKNFGAPTMHHQTFEIKCGAIPAGPHFAAFFPLRRKICKNRFTSWGK